MISNFHIRLAAHAINQHGIISYPTESVFGLGCNPLSEIAVSQLLRLKQRSMDKGLILIAGDLGQLLPYISLSQQQLNKIKDSQQATTWLVKKSKRTPAWISGKHSLVAIRLSQHPLVVKLCKRLNQPIVSTSCNPSGAKPASSNLQSRRYFLNQVDYYLNGTLGGLSKPTRIIELNSGKIVR